MQLHPLLRIAFALAVGILVGDALSEKLSAGMWIVATVASLSMAIGTWKHCLVQGCGIMVTVFCTGGLMAARARTNADVRLAEGYVNYEAVVISQPTVAGKVVRCDAVIANTEYPTKIKANIWGDARSRKLCIGDGITATSVMEEPRNFRKSSFDYRRYLKNQGFAATTFIASGNWTKSRVRLDRLSWVLRTQLAALKFRQRLLGKYRASGLANKTLAAAAAMTLGDKSAVSKEMKNEYSISGASHLLALSGLHLGIVYAVLSIFSFGRKYRWLNETVILLAIWGYAVVTGLSPSVVRSALMVSIYALMSMAHRDKMSLNVLSFAAIVMLMANPLNIYDVGFQMSFMAVTAILVFYKPIYGRLPDIQNRGLKWVWQLMAVSLAVQIGTAPLVALYFGRFSCYFLLTNLIAIPLATAIIYCAMGVVVLSAVPVLQGYATTLLAPVAKALNSALAWIAGLPGASMDGIHINGLQTLMIYVVSSASYLLLSRTGTARRKREEDTAPSRGWKRK